MLTVSTTLFEIPFGERDPGTGHEERHRIRIPTPGKPVDQGVIDPVRKKRLYRGENDLKQGKAKRMRRAGQREVESAESLIEPRRPKRVTERPKRMGQVGEIVCLPRDDRVVRARGDARSFRDAPRFSVRRSHRAR